MPWRRVSVISTTLAAVWYVVAHHFDPLLFAAILAIIIAVTYVVVNLVLSPGLLKGVVTELHGMSLVMQSLTHDHEGIGRDGSIDDDTAAHVAAYVSAAAKQELGSSSPAAKLVSHFISSDQPNRKGYSPTSAEQFKVLKHWGWILMYWGWILTIQITCLAGLFVGVASVLAILGAITHLAFHADFVHLPCIEFLWSWQNEAVFRSAYSMGRMAGRCLGGVISVTFLFPATYVNLCVYGFRSAGLMVAVLADEFDHQVIIRQMSMGRRRRRVQFRSWHRVRDRVRQWRNDDANLFLGLYLVWAISLSYMGKAMASWLGLIDHFPSWLGLIDPLPGAMSIDFRLVAGLLANALMTTLIIGLAH
mmetsp:Transcript_2215/g.5697  ORF Transcript_2215/g.5697 Transcript_2215/m.5697 type:complete len:362 (-) Transcript_2215:425-1510(-)